jgi:hypothetical protein
VKLLIKIKFNFFCFSRYITGMLPNEPKSMNEMRQDEQKWVKRCEGLVDCYGGIDLQSDFVKDLSESTGYHPDAQKGRELFYVPENGSSNGKTLDGLVYGV